MSKSNLAYFKPRVRAQFDAPDADDPLIAELLEMHTYARPANSVGERVFNTRYLDSISGMMKDEKGNRFIRIGNAPVLWSSHTDTVHRVSGRPKLTYGDGLLTLRKGEEATCLGADCTVGVWIMRQMILRQAPGLYVFHAEEEIGGYGSKFIADKNPELLKGINYAIALDRRGTDSVISHQFWRTASDAFCVELAEYLGPMWSPDDTGTFTDTANYIDHIPECTNLSVGYYNAHSRDEVLDVSFAADLLERLTRLDTNALPVLRQPMEDYRYTPADSTYGGREEDADDWHGHLKVDDFLPKLNVKRPITTLLGMVEAYPEMIVSMLDELGISEEDVQSYIANNA